MGPEGPMPPSALASPVASGPPSVVTGPPPVPGLPPEEEPPPPPVAAWLPPLEPPAAPFPFRPAPEQPETSDAASHGMTRTTHPRHTEEGIMRIGISITFRSPGDLYRQLLEAPGSAH